MERAIVTLTATPPYDFNLTAAYAVYFRGHYGAEGFDGCLFRRLLDLWGASVSCQRAFLGHTGLAPLFIQFFGFPSVLANSIEL